MIRNVQKLLRKKRKKQQANNVQIPKPQEVLFKDFNKNVELFRSVYNHCSDVVFREFCLFGNVQAIIIYIEGLADTEKIDNHVLSPLMQKKDSEPRQPSIEFIESNVSVSKTKKLSLWADCIESISTGSSILLMEGENQALSLGLTKFEARAIEEPEAEKVLRGPREGFIESLQVNTAMLRRTIKSPALKIQSIKLGKYSKTSVVLAYMNGIANPTLIQEVENRLKRIDIDGFIDTNYIEEMIEDNPFSPFPQLMATERPDVVSSNILEGRVAILAEGTPFALVAPTTFFSLLQAPDDYYERYIVGTVIRWLRYIFLFISLVLPSLYVAITSFHQEMIPDPLLLSIAAARENVPFPALVEVVIMELMLEALREAGVRLPNQIGAAVSIVGALVIGQAAVQAGLVSAPMVIVVATTGIASFMSPHYILGYSIRLLRFPMMVLAATLGLLGIMMGILALVIHLCTLRSFGEPYLAPLAPLKKHELKDVLWRAPIWEMDKRPHFEKDMNEYRQAPNQKPGPLRGGETEH
ncbi:spore germination protein KA [Bacillus thermophilus]|uniref:Spore germination protein KA n=1 Tax=Siminovitchia thermophila TaxID=1245522 RepID=A0ABS2R7B1_9BACI|nr:spore germination protein [Siminovitchia thermophila]MBM7715536.1 spore germination protein KA [Siminovitchia thermophila]ONK20958.1 hypothetical protein BLX87_24430 [Bacillus sp. VT-16-64]